LGAPARSRTAAGAGLAGGLQGKARSAPAHGASPARPKLRLFPVGRRAFDLGQGILASRTKQGHGLALDHVRPLQSRYVLAMAPLLFTCPVTSMKVQHWLDDDQDAPENEYEAITCAACTRVHLLNRKTGKLLGQDEE
jgi:hypothetical protein